MSIQNTLKASIVELVTAAVAAALIVTIPAKLTAQRSGTPQAAAQTAHPEEHEEAANAPRKPGQEGIRVHGHWVMDVHDKDGKLVEHRDFYNSLTANGGGILLRLIDGTAVAEKFNIILDSNVGLIYAMVQTPSYFASLACPNAAVYVCSTTASQKLVIVGNQTGTPTALVIAGQLTADRAVTFSRVTTNSIMCHNGTADNNANSPNQTPISTSPADCDSLNFRPPIEALGGYFYSNRHHPAFTGAGSGPFGERNDFLLISAAQDNALEVAQEAFAGSPPKRLTRLWRTTMKTFEFKFTTALLVTMLVPGPYSSAIAQQRGSAKAARAGTPSHVSAKPAVEEEDEKSSPSKPGTEGIKVHGHWILDLKDKDGKLIEHRDFHNSLSVFGGDTLAKLITGLAVGSALQIQAGGFIIYRGDIANHAVPSCNANPPASVACVPNLTVAYTSFDLPNNVPGSFVTLHGSITPTTATTVSTVQTSAMICESPAIPVPSTLLTESPARCAANDLDAGYRTDNYPFTGTSITPINVAAGQTLAITVIISFS